MRLRFLLRLGRVFVCALALAWVAAGESASGQLFSSGRSGPALIEFLDIGQGDAILVRSPEGRTALIDAGPSRDVVKHLRDRGLKKIDLVVISHHHSDHYGGMDDVLREFQPKYFVATNSAHTTSQYLRLLKQVREQNIQAVVPTGKPRDIELGSVVMTLFPQPPENKKEENCNSIGLRVRHGNVSILLTGDSETEERRWWLEHCPDLIRDCDILKLAHHGSRNGTDARWLDLVRPELAIASLATGNDYGHPHSETLALLRQSKIPLLQTNLAGTVTIRSDGKTYQVSHSTGGSRAPPEDGRIADQAPKSSTRDRAARTTSNSRRDSGRIDLNHASQNELQTLPGIGPSTARKIIDGRPYQTIDDLRRVQGIGETRFAEVAPRIMVR